MRTVTRFRKLRGEPGKCSTTWVGGCEHVHTHTSTDMYTYYTYMYTLVNIFLCMQSCNLCVTPAIIAQTNEDVRKARSTSCSAWRVRGKRPHLLPRAAWQCTWHPTWEKTHRKRPGAEGLSSGGPDEDGVAHSSVSEVPKNNLALFWGLRFPAVWLDQWMRLGRRSSCCSS